MIKHFAADGTVKREWPDGLHASGFEQDGKRFASVAKSNSVETVELADGEQVGETFIPQTAAQAAREVILQAAAEDGIQVHESQLAPPMPIAEEDVHPIESALADDLNLTLHGTYVRATSDVSTLSENVGTITVSATDVSAPEPLPPVAIAPDPEPADIVMGTGPDAKPMIETELGELVPAPGVSNSQKIGSAPADLAASTALIPVDIHPIEAALAAAIPGSTTVHHVPSPSEVVETAAHALSDAAEVLKQEEARNGSSAEALNVEPQEAQATHSTEAVQIPSSEATNG